MQSPTFLCLVLLSLCATSALAIPVAPGALFFFNYAYSGPLADDYRLLANSTSDAIKTVAQPKELGGVFWEFPCKTTRRC